MVGRWCSAPTDASTPASATAAAAVIPTTMARTSARCSARSSASAPATARHAPRRRATHSSERPGPAARSWALGLRNPWRITFDRQTGDLLIADVGQDSREEVNVQPAAAAGRNYCWRRKEGTLIFDANIPCTAGTPTDPVLEYDHSGGNCSITGGYRYRGSKFPGFVGTYFYGDFCSGRIWGATESGGAWTTVELLDTALNISSFGEDEAGEIYVAHLFGALYRLGGVGMNTHDFNGDGKSDIAWRQSGGAAAVWLMNGAQVSQSGGLGTVPTNWQIVGQRDFNGDGKHDWLWRDTPPARWRSGCLNGLQVLQTGGLGTVPSNWTIVGTGGLQRRRQGRHSLARWRHRHGGDLAAERLCRCLQTGESRRGAEQLDHRRHRRLQRRRQGRHSLARQQHRHGGDLVHERPAGRRRPAASARCRTTGRSSAPATSTATARATFSGATPAPATVAIWLLNGLQVSQTGGLGTVPSNWIIAETGDFNGDGKSDILWRDNNTGAVAIWFMNGLQVSSSAGVGTVGLDWTIQGLNAD